MTTCSLDCTTVWIFFIQYWFTIYIKKKSRQYIYCAGCCKAVCSLALIFHFISTSALYAHLQCIMWIYHKVALYQNIIHTCRFQQELISVMVPAQQKMSSLVTLLWSHHHVTAVCPAGPPCQPNLPSCQHTLGQWQLCVYKYMFQSQGSVYRRIKDRKHSS